MKTTIKIIKCLSICAFIFFVISLWLLYIYKGSESILYNIVVAQLIFFAVLSGLIIFFIMPFDYQVSGTKRIGEIAKIVPLSETNEPIESKAFYLTNKSSAIIAKNDTVYVTEKCDMMNEIYAVINKVDGYWYLERETDARRVGLKPAGEQLVYKVKPDMGYRLNINDIIYIDDDRLKLTDNNVRES